MVEFVILNNHYPERNLLESTIATLIHVFPVLSATIYRTGTNVVHARKDLPGTGRNVRQQETRANQIRAIPAFLVSQFGRESKLSLLVDCVQMVITILHILYKCFIWS